MEIDSGRVVTIFGRRPPRIDFQGRCRYTIGMSRQSTRCLLFAAGLMIVAIAGYSLFWYSAVTGVRSGIERWAEERRARGWTVALGTPDISGFPFLIDVRFQTPGLGGPQNQWRWDLPNVRAAARPWTPGKVSVSAPGIHVLVAGDDETSLRLAQVDGDLEMRSGRFHRLVVRLSGIEFDQGDGVRLQAETFTSRVQAGVTVNGGTANRVSGLGIAFEAREVALPAAWRPPLGPGLSRLSVDAVALGQIEPRGKLTDALARWRDQGGAIEVNTLALDWQALSLRANGTFALDEDLQPQGAMTARIEGIDPTADALIAAGVIDAKTAFAAKVANRALSFGSGAPRLPLSVQKSRLYLGPVPILRLKPIRWK